MTFETNQDVLCRSGKRPPILSAEFINNSAWENVGRSSLPGEKFVPVLLYTRDVETLTEVYYDHHKRERPPAKSCHPQIYGTSVSERVDASRINQLIFSGTFCPCSCLTLAKE